ncbi:uncharacterized protein LOC127786476 isoform X1 [Diospyros lotus]|uniref:uncharacterized protein LOC127786476 isoform X1 n=1 Tax=Diospyros lotus TaxID=55363 RepID=UPI002258F838|nr:uncharacterized protein LOC127786476 isoform X1 [Diospyros lotus]
MAEKASVTSSAAAIAITVGEGMNSEHVSATVRFFENCGPSATVPQQVEAISLSNFVRGLLKVDSIERGRLSCLVSVKPPSTNIYGGMHGGAVASVAERLSIACARTVVGRDKELFLGELSISYLSAAPLNGAVHVSLDTLLESFTSLKRKNQSTDMVKELMQTSHRLVLCSFTPLVFLMSVN